MKRYVTRIGNESIGPSYIFLQQDSPALSFIDASTCASVHSLVNQGGGGVNMANEGPQNTEHDVGSTVGGLEFNAFVRRLDRAVERGEALPYD